MKSKKYVVTHKLERDIENLKIPSVTTTGETGIVELSPSGVKIGADSLDGLSSLRFAATIAVKYASEWRNLVLTTEAVFEDGKQILRTGTIMLEFSKVENRIDENTYQNTMNTLLAVDSDCLTFLMRAFELQDRVVRVSTVAFV